MPGGDGRGPLGLGPGTGRWGAGYCTPQRPYGLFGSGRRTCWGYGYRGFQPMPGERPGERPDEKEVLKQEAELLREQLKHVEARLHAVTSSETKEDRVD